MSITRFQFSPSMLPSKTNMVFHKKEPNEVSNINIVKLYLEIPAGIEIKLLRIGINLHIKIDFPPSSLNTSIESSILSSFSLNSFPNLDRVMAIIFFLFRK